MEGWFCSNLWHCGHVTHINQGFTLPLITSWENDQTLVSPLMRRPTISRAGLNNSINSTRKDWLSFCDSLKAHNPGHYRLQSFPFRLIGCRPIYFQLEEWGIIYHNLFEGWRGQATALVCLVQNRKMWRIVSVLSNWINLGNKKFYLWGHQLKL